MKRERKRNWVKMMEINASDKNKGKKIKQDIDEVKKKKVKYENKK